MGTPSEKSRQASRVGLSFVEKLRIALMFVVLIFISIFILGNHDFGVSKITRVGEPWYKGHKQEYEGIIKLKVEKKVKLKEQHELGLKLITEIPYKKEFLPLLNKGVFKDLPKEVQNLLIEKVGVQLSSNEKEPLSLRNYRTREWRLVWNKKLFILKKESKVPENSEQKLAKKVELLGLYEQDHLQIKADKFPFIWEPTKLQKEVEQNVPYFNNEFHLNILQKVSTLTQEDILKGVEAQNKEEKITYEHLVKVPEKLPGLFVQFPGTLYEVRRKTVPVNLFGLKEIWESYIYDGDYNLFTFQTIAPPSDFYLKDNVTLNGIFYKVMVYEDTQGNLRATPVILGRELASYKRKFKQKNSDEIEWAILALVGLGMVALVIAIVIENKRSKKMRQELMSRKKENLKSRQRTSAIKKSKETEDTQENQGSADSETQQQENSKEKEENNSSEENSTPSDGSE